MSFVNRSLVHTMCSHTQNLTDAQKNGPLPHWYLNVIVKEIN